MSGQDCAGDTARRRMSGGELRIAREYLGLDHQQLGHVLKVNPATVQNWELNKAAIPYGVTGEVKELRRITRARVEDLAAYLRANPQAAVPVYSDKDRLPDTERDIATYGTKWWRMVVARATEDLPDAHVGTPTEISRYGDKWWDIVTQRPASDSTTNSW